MDHGMQFEPEADQQVKGPINRGPVEDRSCKDICCLVFFILLTLLFIIGGVLFIVKADFTNMKSFTFPNSKTSSKHFANAMQEEKQIKFEDIKKCFVYVIGMAALALVLAIVYVILLSKFPKCVVYTMLAFTLIFLTAMVIMLFASGSYVGGIITFIILLFWVCMICCYKDKLQIGIVLLKVSGQFLTNKPSVFCVPVFTTILGLLFLTFWVYSLVAIGVSYPNQKQNTVQKIFIILWVVLSTFYIYFIYYIMVFLIATAAALWYFKRNDSYWLKGIKWIISAHVGSLTFASVIVTLISLLRQQTQKSSQRNSQNSCHNVCFCLLLCCIRSIEQLIKVLNHNAVIVMSITGQDYIDSAKTTLGLIWQDFALYQIVQMIGGIVLFGGILFVVGIPSFVGYLLMKHIMENGDMDAIAVGVVAIIIITLIISIIMISVISQALSSVFILYCLDRKYKMLQPAVANEAPIEMRDLFSQMNLNMGLMNSFNEQNLNPGGNNIQPNYNQPNYNQPNYGQPYQNQQGRFNPSGQYGGYGGPYNPSGQPGYYNPQFNQRNSGFGQPNNVQYPDLNPVRPNNRDYRG